MNTLIAVSISPIGKSEEVSSEVAEVIKVISESGLSYRTNSMFTEIEGPWDEVIETVKNAANVLLEKNIRTTITLKADIRPGHQHTMDSKVKKIDKLLEDNK